jgi:hypothetical protein
MEMRCVYLPDRVSGAETDPLRDRTVGLLGLGQLDLGAERFVALRLCVSYARSRLRCAALGIRWIGVVISFGSRGWRRRAWCRWRSLRR